MPAGQPSVRATSCSTSPAARPSPSRSLRNSPASASVKRSSSARSSSSWPCARRAPSGSGGSARVESTICSVARRVVDEPGDALARGRARQPVEVVEHERQLALLGERVHEPREHDLEQRRGRDRRRQLRVRQLRAGAAQRLDRVRPQRDRVVVALVQRHPRRRRGLARRPRRQQRRLAEPGRAGDEAELRAAPGAQAREQPLAGDRLGRHHGRVELRDEQRRLHAADRNRSRR